MIRRPGEKPVDTPGGKAAERLREFEAARGYTEASEDSHAAAQEGLPPQNAGEAPKHLSAKDAGKKASVKQSTHQKKRTAKQRSGPRRKGARVRRPKEK